MEFFNYGVKNQLLPSFIQFVRYDLEFFLSHYLNCDSFYDAFFQIHEFEYNSEYIVDEWENVNLEIEENLARLSNNEAAKYLNYVKEKIYNLTLITHAFDKTQTTDNEYEIIYNDYFKQLETISEYISFHLDIIDNDKLNSNDSSDLPETVIKKDVDKLRIIIKCGIYKLLKEKLAENQIISIDQVVRIIIDLGITDSKDLKSVSSQLRKLIKGDTNIDTPLIESKMRNLKLIK